MAHWPESYRVSALPQDHPWGRYFSLTVDYWKDGLWMIRDGQLQCDAEGNYGHPWDYEDRREEFLAKFRWQRDQALEIAEKLAVEKEGPGEMTARDVLSQGLPKSSEED